ncbi:MAG: hypothetical protein QXQ76_00975 [Candidatus Bathyarchaeia archaeon]
MRCRSRRMTERLIEEARGALREWEKRRLVELGLSEDEAEAWLDEAEAMGGPEEARMLRVFSTEAKHRLGR